MFCPAAQARVHELDGEQSHRNDKHILGAGNYTPLLIDVIT
jgi:hypothetical protein